MKNECFPFIEIDNVNNYFLKRSRLNSNEKVSSAIWFLTLMWIYQKYWKLTNNDLFRNPGASDSDNAKKFMLSHSNKNSIKKELSQRE